MQQQTYIRATFTPEKQDEEKGMQPDPDRAMPVTIVTFSDRDNTAIFIDYVGRLHRGSLHQFSNCVFVTI